MQPWYCIANNSYMRGQMASAALAASYNSLFPSAKSSRRVPTTDSTCSGPIPEYENIWMILASPALEGVPSRRLSVPRESWRELKFTDGAVIWTGGVP